jgi:peptide/nickel transport system permease protein
VWRRVLATNRGKIGVAICFALILLVIFGRLVAPFSPTEIGTGPVSAGPSGSHLFGTDSLGRDVFSRVLAGGTLVLVLPLVANVVASLIGGFFGIWGAYEGGRVDAIVTRLFDVLLALPPLLMVLVIIAGLGSSTGVILLAMVFFFVPRAGRVLRGAAQAVVSEDYVAASEALGERTRAILWRDIVPNMMSPAIADFALRTTYGIIFVTTLSFLGLGTQPPKADWGLMVSENRSLLTSNPLAVLGPIAAIALLSISINLIADAISGSLGGQGSEEGAML